MIAIVARKEVTEIGRDGRFRWAAITMLVLLIAALLVGWQRFLNYHDVREHVQETTNAQFAGQRDKHPHSGAHFGNYALKKVGGLYFFDSGMAEYTGNLVWMVAHNQNSAVARPADDLNALARFGDLDGAMILQVLMPLLIVFLAFTAFAGERERGTLRQLMAMGVPASRILWGKAIGITIVIALIIGPCLLIGSIALAIAGVPDVIDSFGARVGLTILAYSAYGLVFLFLSLAVSARVRTARAALVILVGFWAFSVFLMPKLAVEIAKTMHPSPTVGEFVATLQNDRKQGLHGKSPKERLAQFQLDVWSKYGVTSNAELPVGWIGLLLQELEDLDHEIYDFHYQRLRASYKAQSDLANALGIVDPVLPLFALSAGLAGTDLMHHNRFTIAAENHRRMMVKRVNSYLTRTAVADNVFVNPRDAKFTAGREFFATIPPFSYEPPGLSDVLAEYRLCLGILGAWLMASVLLAASAVRSMQGGTD